MNKSHLLVIFLSITLIFPQSSEGFPSVKKHARVLGKLVGTKARFGFLLPALKVKGALIAAPLVAGAAVGAKLATVGALALPVTVGAALGAPIGAVVGAIGGAKLGALKGAAVGKMILLKKLALAKHFLLKKAAIMAPVVKMGALIAAKPILIAAGLKTALVAKKLALLAKGMAVAGQGIAIGGKALKHGGAKITALTTNLHSTIGDGISNVVRSMAVRTLPTLPLLPAILPTGLPVKAKGPFAFDLQYSLNSPITGPRFGKALILGNRRRRSADAEPLGNTPSSFNINQLIQFVQKSNAQQCLARVICELSANPNVLGVEGIKFGTSLLTMSRVNHPGTSQYRTASIVGSRARNPAICSTRFPNCSTDSSEVVRVGNNLISG